jgi:alanyl-tRNA synthetase
LQEENKQLQRRLRASEELAARAEARELLEESEGRDGVVEGGAGVSGIDDDGAGGLRLVARVFEGREAEDLRRLASAVAAHAGAVALLGSRDGSGARLVFARHADAPGDMNSLLREACRALEGRGGGRPDLAQGGGPRTDLLHHVIEQAARSLRA